MPAAEDRQARALEGILAQLTLLVGLQKKQTEKMLNVDELRELRTASGRLVGYMLPGEEIALHDLNPVTMSEREKVLQLLAESSHPFIVIQETVETVTENTKFRGFAMTRDQHLMENIDHRFDVVGTVKGLIIPDEWK